MVVSLAPVFSQPEAPRKAAQTSLFSSPFKDTFAVSSCAFFAALFVSLFGLTWGLQGAGSHLDSPLTLPSCLALWGTVFVGFLSRMKSNTVDSRESSPQTSDLAGADWMRGRTRLPFRHSSPNVPREDSRLSPDLRGYLAHMSASDFASVFPPPQPSLFRREEVYPHGGGKDPNAWQRNSFNQGRFEPYALRPDRLGGLARALRFGKFRAKGSSRVPLPLLSRRGYGGRIKVKGSSQKLAPFPPHHGLGFRRDPRTGLWKGITSGVSVSPPKRPNPNPKKAKSSKRTKPNPALSLESN